MIIHAGTYRETVNPIRGGTAHDTKIYNNIFYGCGEAAIKFPTEKNESEGNMFAKMPPGYLRIRYPAPTECLDLKARREFRGFDLTGFEADFKINIDTERFTMEIIQVDPQPERYLSYRTGRKTTEFAAFPKVQADPCVTIDFFG